jgi:hypothetical protein
MTLSVVSALIVAIILCGLFWRFRTSPLMTIKKKGALPRRFKHMKISKLQRRYGDKNPDRNPYAKKHTTDSSRKS